MNKNFVAPFLKFQSFTYPWSLAKNTYFKAIGVREGMGCGKILP